MPGEAKSLCVDDLRHAEYYGMQPVFDELYRKSKNGEIFTNLMEIILRRENILLAYRNIKTNGGSYTAGTDNRNITDIGSRTPEEVVEKVRFIVTGSRHGYRPKPVRRKDIPKPNGKTRPLGIPCIWDRLIQQCIKQVMEPICEAQFSDNSYGFRPNRSAEHAIARTYSLMQVTHLHYVIEFDIKGFFDNVNHSKLIKQIWAMGIRDKQLIFVIKRILTAPIRMPDGTTILPNKGTPQGGIISPLLANIVLNELDHWVESQWQNNPVAVSHGRYRTIGKNEVFDKSHGYRAMKSTNLKEMYIVRYADDFRIFCRSKDDAEKTMEAVTQWLEERLRLEVSPEKTRTVNVRKRYSEFLGFKIRVRQKAKKYTVQSHMCDKKFGIEREKLVEQAKRIARPSEGKTPLGEIRTYNSMVMGIQNYFEIATCKPVTVFDVSQTSGKPLPQLANDLSGNVQDYEAFMEAIRRASPVPIEIKPIGRGMDGFFSPEDQSITLREGMSEVQTVCAAIHEIAHSKLHNYEKQKEAAAAASDNTEPVKKKDRRTEEVEAESISYSVCAYYGIATGENSFGYIATWSKDKELPELRASLETINKTASELITDIDRSYAQLMKEREAEKGSQEQAVPTSEPDVTMGVQEKTQTQEHKIDPAISVDAMNAYGYTDENMQPLSKEQALELYERDVPVYMLYTDNTEAMAFDAEEIRSHDGFFGVSREDWEAAKMGFEPEVDRPDYEKSFLDDKEDGFLLLQLNDVPETRDFRFMDMEYLRQKEMQVSHDNYGAVYSGSLPPGTDSRDALDNIYTRFNIDRPQDFTGHSLSVSDIIVLRQQGRVSCHYVDSWGFKELPQFLPENYLKNAEMAMEDDYGMIDGIINNGKSPARVEQERQTDERPSVLEKLRSYSTQERTEVPKKNAPSRGAEREI